LQRETGDRTEALRSFQAALRLQTTLVEKHRESLKYQADLAETHNSLGVLQSAMGDRAAAVRSWQEALRLQTTLTEKYPEVTKYHTDLAGTRINVAGLLCDEGKLQDSLAEYTQAITALSQLRRRFPDHPTARLYLGKAHHWRGLALGLLNRYAEAAADLEEALALDTENSVLLRFKLTSTRASAGDQAHRLLSLARTDSARAAAEATTFDCLPSPPGSLCYDLARVWSLCSATARKDGKLPAAEQAKLAEQYAGRAFDWLSKSRDGGYFKDPANIAHMKKDTDLDPLRDRDDLKKLLAELEKEAGKEKPKDKPPGK
jgi:tetratricopeptide (TPR) repeat protein